MPTNQDHSKAETMSHQYIPPIKKIKLVDSGYIRLMAWNVNESKPTIEEQYLESQKA